MLVEKEKIKQKIIEYISNQFWIKNTNPTFTDVYDEFKNFLSKGSTSNYLEELIQEKKIVKINQGNNVFYSPPKIHPATKYIIVLFLALTPTSIYAYVFHESYAPIFFGFGAFFTAFLWRVFGV